MQQIFWATTDIKDLDFKNIARQRLAQGQPDMFYDKIDGVPLRMEMKHPKGTMTMEATELKRESLAAAELYRARRFQRSEVGVLIDVYSNKHKKRQVLRPAFCIYRCFVNSICRSPIP